MIVIFNFFLLSFNTSLIDIVLNSIASLFIIELDDIAVFLSNDSLMDLIKQNLINKMFYKFSNINVIYFNNTQNHYDTWVYHNSPLLKLNAKHYELDKNTMEIIKKENVPVTPISTISTTSTISINNTIITIDLPAINPNLYVINEEIEELDEPQTQIRLTSIETYI